MWFVIFNGTACLKQSVSSPSSVAVVTTLTVCPASNCTCAITAVVQRLALTSASPRLCYNNFFFSKDSNALVPSNVIFERYKMFGHHSKDETVKPSFFDKHFSQIAATFWWCQQLSSSQISCIHTDKNSVHACVLPGILFIGTRNFQFFKCLCYVQLQQFSHILDCSFCCILELPSQSCFLIGWLAFNIARQLRLWAMPRGRAADNFTLLSVKGPHGRGQNVWAMLPPHHSLATLLASSAGDQTNKLELGRPAHC